MCFSAPASFGLSALLLPAGAYCVRSAVQKNKRLLGLAAIPFIFSVQQFSEGVVWIEMERHEPNHGALLRVAALCYLYFALAFWPFWVPMCALLTERHIRKKWLLAPLAVLGFATGMILFLPLVLNPDLLNLTIWHHSIVYDITQSVAFQNMPILWWKVLYVAIVAIPILIAPLRGFGAFGIALVVAAIVSHVFYWNAFISVWCFVAAMLAVCLCYSFMRLPRPGMTMHPAPVKADLTT